MIHRASFSSLCRFVPEPPKRLRPEGGERTCNQSKFQNHLGRVAPLINRSRRGREVLRERLLILLIAHQAKDHAHDKGAFQHFRNKL